MPVAAVPITWILAVVPREPRLAATKVRLDCPVDGKLVEVGERWSEGPFMDTAHVTDRAERPSGVVMTKFAAQTRAENMPWVALAWKEDSLLH